MKYKPRQLTVGEQIYLTTYSSWGRNSYRLARVDKISPTGRITVKVGNLALTFRPDGNQIGGGYGYDCIDWMPVAERSEYGREVNRVIAGVNVLNGVLDLTPLRGRYERPEVLERIAIMRQMIEKAESALAGTDTDEGAS